MDTNYRIVGITKAFSDLAMEDQREVTVFIFV
jgi:hypothetical protein